jgi:hypothetical protein
MRDSSSWNENVSSKRTFRIFNLIMSDYSIQVWTVFSKTLAGVVEERIQNISIRIKFQKLTRH